MVQPHTWKCYRSAEQYQWKDKSYTARQVVKLFSVLKAVGIGNLSAGALILENLTAKFYLKNLVVYEERPAGTLVSWHEKGQKYPEGAKIAQNRGPEPNKNFFAWPEVLTVSCLPLFQEGTTVEFLSLNRSHNCPCFGTVLQSAADNHFHQ